MSLEFFTNLIWIDSNINNKDNITYLKYLETIFNLKLIRFDNVKNGLEFLLSISFEDTIIITSDRLYNEFIEEFKENLNQVYIIPKIIIFTNNKLNFLDYNKNYNSFYKFGGIADSFDDIKNFILNKKIKEENKEENSYSFEFMDSKEKLNLSLIYQSLLNKITKVDIEKFTEFIYDKYPDNDKIKSLFNSVKSIPNIPIELLSKYYSRLYTIESNFYKDLNKDLRNNKIEKYLPFIKVLYEGIKLKSLLPPSGNIFYRGGRISNNEISLIKKYLEEKNSDMSGIKVFSKVFLSFFKSKRIAERFLKYGGENKNLSSVLYILEKNDNLDDNLVSCSDMEKLSFYPNEEEVLFFPFSSFIIKDIKETSFNDKKLYIINLKYLGSDINKTDNKNDKNDKNKESIDCFKIDENENKNLENISQIEELKKQLNDEKNKNQKLLYENQSLKEKIKQLSLEIGKLKLLEDKIKFLEKNIIEKNIEIQKYKTENFIKSDDDSIKSIHPGEKIIGVNFVSMGTQDIGHYNIVCKNTDIFIRLEEKLFNDFPQFKDYETYFTVKTKRIKRYKTLDENNIQNNDIVNIFIIDE